MKIFLKYFFHLFKYSRYKIIEYDVNRIEFVWLEKHTNIQMSKHVFQICIDWIIQDDTFLKVVLLLCSNMFCEMFYLLCCFTFAGCFVPCSHWCVYFQIPYNTMDFYEWKLNLTWSCKWIIWKRITEYFCWSVHLQLTYHIKICPCDDSMPK